MGLGAVRAGHCEWIGKVYVGCNFCLAKRVRFCLCGYALSSCSKYSSTHVGRASP